ncbi:site-specific DNA-methyltransferase [Kingella kingae]|uniref:DNA methyltransferase n=1 Tax=Kingella kingae TaxID=504 RepID=UPI0002584B0C|nr:site-specific DNA-methyltransferase [Kingella kingae]EIC13918.1 type III restriction/modification system modification methylase [Kingella kingae PYKK081]MDK4568893.1 site-specific DNA-methyltransferase [Kingella kingae]MDK4570875.1 site-specific DNA-methyltransferase [Kingella kingae]MDK4572806.1 site-specific DNA-methyltransferase [Kingella kingae]MDK4598887.1 site-specific DNA-methyltransferase [Kingella kingae]
MNTDIQTELTQALLSHEKVWANEEKTILAKNILLDLVEKTDPTIIGLLLGNDELKHHFFVEVNGVLVFKLQDFRFFLDKHSINNSYTKYANRIGLTDGNHFLKDNSDIVLDFPFKDCVLNGGQSTEEGEEIYFKRNNNQSDSQLYTKLTRKRQEIFFNQILAFDEIDRLFDAKAFSKFSRYTADGEQPVGEIKRHSDGTPAENLIIKGNNLIALHSLAKQFKGKVKLIYIDPPYYFVKKKPQDSFGYNTNFKLSTWLTFMKNRLLIAKELLTDDGIIVISIDDDGNAYLKILLDEIFGFENFIGNLPTIMNLKGNNDEYAFAGTHEYTLVFANKKEKSTFYEFLVDEYEMLQDWEEDNIGFYKQGANLKSTGVNAPREKRPNLFFPIFIDSSNKVYVTDDNKKPITYTGGLETIYPITDGKEMSWRWSKNKFINQNNDVIVSRNNGSISLYKKQRPKLDDLPTKKPKTIFYKPEYSSGNGTEQMKNLFGEKAFKNPKPEELIQDFIAITTNESDIILDYHLGSGTTAAVAHKMNRQYIGIEQMDYIETLAVERLKKVIKGEQGGISKAVNWQGGGEFVYTELAPFNETAKQQILACESAGYLKVLFEDLCEHYFLKYNVSVNEFSQIINEPEFQALPLDEQKQMVLEMLDLNQMYVSLSEMDDEQFAGCLNDDDKALSRAFYQAEKKDGE